MVGCLHRHWKRCRPEIARVNPQWPYLPEIERVAFRAIVATLDGQLESRETFDWALRTTHSPGTERLAVLSALDRPKIVLREPWRTAWALLEEAWSFETPYRLWVGSGHDLNRRLANGDRSGALVSKIVDLVRPRLVAEAPTRSFRPSRSRRDFPRHVSDLARFHITSAVSVGDERIKLANISDVSFLMELAHALEWALVRGLDIATRLGWKGGNGFWQLGELHRVEYRAGSSGVDDDSDPDRFHKGVAPCVRMLYAIVARLCDLDLGEATRIVECWRLQDSAVHVRLWAAMARDKRLADGSEVGVFLRQAPADNFWHVQSFPEMSELRAVRFVDLSIKDKNLVTRRLLEGPPAKWFKRVDKDRQLATKNYWIARELQRVKVAGAALTEDGELWLSQNIESFPEIGEMTDVQADFPAGIRVRWAQHRPDHSFNLMSGTNRLQALEEALSSEEKTWDKDVAGQAEAWLREPGKLKIVIEELVQQGVSAARYPRMWSHIGWFHRPPNHRAKTSSDDEGNASELGKSVLTAIESLPDNTLESAIDGLSSWLDSWASSLWPSDKMSTTWLKLWPVAVTATNADKKARLEASEEESLSSIVGSDTENERFDSLNNPAGRMAGAFLSCLPTIGAGDKPFSDRRLRAMRNASVSADGFAGLVARHRLTELLAWFLVADRDWALEVLVKPLRSSGDDARILWMALAHGRRSKPLIQELGTHMLSRAQDRALPREARKALVFSLLVDCLFSLKDLSAPTVPSVEITQMIRGLEDEIRGFAATVPLKFLQDLSTREGDQQETYPPEEIAHDAIIPFMHEVWPQERSLSQPSTARALAGLPARSGNRFVEMVESIHRFLVPFDCWGLYEYKFSPVGDDAINLKTVDSAEKGAAFLKLLDSTIGTRDDSVVPTDLALALARIAEVNPTLATDSGFRRLAARARL